MNEIDFICKNCLYFDMSHVDMAIGYCLKYYDGVNKAKLKICNDTCNDFELYNAFIYMQGIVKK